MGKRNSINKSAPNSKRRQNLSAKNASTFCSPEFGMTSKCPSVYLKTFGCQMNVRDSEVVVGLLQKSGYEITATLEKAEIVIFNTCSVRQHAEDKVWSEIGRIAKCQKKMGTVPKGRGQSLFSKPLIGMIGCMAQNYKEAAFERSVAVDFVVGPADIAKIPQIVARLSQGGKRGQSPKNGDSPLFQRRIWETDAESRPEEIYHTGFYEDKNHAFVVISEGCSNFCSYCVVPYVRGGLHHRNYKDILKEIRGALKQGLTRFTLLGQNVNAYACGKVDFVGLLKMVDAIDAVEEVNFITSHPKDTSLDLFKAMAEAKKIKKNLHLPVQSGSDRILKSMNRAYTRKIYLDLAKNYRKIVKGAGLTTDIIVGFPGESEADFQDTFDLIKEIRFNAAYIFKYSPRPHTAAFDMADTVSREEKERRHKMILELQKEISKKIKVCAFTFLFLTFTLIGYAANLDSIKTYILKGDYEAAIDEGERRLVKDPRSDELYYFLGISYLKEGNYLRAADLFQVVINAFSSSRFKEEATLGLGDTYLLRRDFNRARDVYEGMIKNNPRTKLKAQIYSRLSEAGSQEGNNEGARDYSSQLKKNYPLSPEARQGQGISSFRQQPSSYYSVQLGSFTNPDNADKLVRKLSNNGYPAYIEDSVFSGARTYRVRVGKLSSRQEAEELVKKLTQEGYPTKLCP